MNWYRSLSTNPVHLQESFIRNFLWQRHLSCISKFALCKLMTLWRFYWICKVFIIFKTYAKYLILLCSFRCRSEFCRLQIYQWDFRIALLLSFSLSLFFFWLCKRYFEHVKILFISHAVWFGVIFLDGTYVVHEAIFFWEKHWLFFF